MRLVVLIILMIACFRLGVEQPVFAIGGALLFAWICMAVFVHSVRWLFGLNAPALAGAGGGSRGCGGRAPRAGGDSPATVGRTRICPDNRCGRVNIGEARFCAQCGRRLA